MTITDFQSNYTTTNIVDNNAPVFLQWDRKALYRLFIKISRRIRRTGVNIPTENNNKNENTEPKQTETKNQLLKHNITGTV